METLRTIELAVPSDILESPSPQWTSKISEMYGPVGTIAMPSNNNTYFRSTFKNMCSSGKIREEPTERTVLKRLVRKNKVNRLVNNFVAKLKRGVSFSNPVDTDLEGEFPVIKDKEGFALNHYVTAVLGLVSVFLTFGLSILYTLALIFPQAEESTAATVLKSISTLFFAVECALQFVTKKTVQGKTLVSRADISAHYLRAEFAPDAINLIIVLISLTSFENDTAFHLIRLLALWKMLQISQKLQAMEKILITNFLRQQYMGLCSILILNVCFAHILAIALNGMTYLNPDSNWLTEKQLAGRIWYERYVWSYYWGTTIMLTVGFGDLAATNFQEALCLIFIELISCMTLSYNINYLGNLINDLRKRHLEKKKDMKTSHLMSRKSNISDELQNRINNFIEGSFLIKQEFNFREQDQLLESLPSDLRQEFMIEANRNIFKSLEVLKTMTLRTQELMAKQIVKKVCHPEELLIRKGEPMKLYILQKGQIGLCARFHQTVFSVTTDRIRVDNKAQSKLLSLGFIKSKNVVCDIKSLAYSILFYLSNEELIDILKQTKMDYEHFCLMRDREEYLLNENELYRCLNCPREFHNKLICPKLHYIPVKSHIIHKYLHKKHLNCNGRVKFRRSPHSKYQLKDRAYNLVEAFRLRIENHSFSADQVSECTDSPGKMSGTSITILPSVRKCEPENHSRDHSHQHAGDMWHIFNNYIARQYNIDFWQIETDMLCNWRYYMIESNPENLGKSKKRAQKFS